ncbi:3'-5' exonuclease [Microbacterium gilvum]
MPLDFTAIDFETANSRPESACQVGMARVRGGAVVATASWLIRPPSGFDDFAPFNSTIHGILADHVVDAPGWADQLGALLDFAGDDPLAAHSAEFDMGVLRRTSAATGAELPSRRYICSLQVARKTYALPSYRLPRSAEAAGFTGFSHHDAEADALACAHIVIDAARRFGAEDVASLAAAAGVPLGILTAVSSAA